LTTNRPGREPPTRRRARIRKVFARFHPNLAKANTSALQFHAAVSMAWEKITGD
jgi:hypothetical protein